MAACAKGGESVADVTKIAIGNFPLPIPAPRYNLIFHFSFLLHNTFRFLPSSSDLLRLLPQHRGNSLLMSYSSWEVFLD